MMLNNNKGAKRKVMTQTMNYEVKDLGLAPEGKKQIEWANKDMPVLEQIRRSF